jgi:hypothetical protein
LDELEDEGPLFAELIDLPNPSGAAEGLGIFPADSVLILLGETATGGGGGGGREWPEFGDEEIALGLSMDILGEDVNYEISN